MGEDAFKAWGWRIPFLVSVILLGVSLWIRMQLAESPVFVKMKSLGTTSKAPLAEAFGRWSNLKIVIISLLGAVMGQAVVWYTGQFYALFFLERTLKVDGATTNILVAIALVRESAEGLVAGKVFNVGDSNENYRKLDLVQEIRKLTDRGTVSYVHRNEDPRDYKVSFDKIRSVLGFNTAMTVPDGIGEVIDRLSVGAFPDPFGSRYRNVP